MSLFNTQINDDEQQASTRITTRSSAKKAQQALRTTQLQTQATHPSDDDMPNMALKTLGNDTDGQGFTLSDQHSDLQTCFSDCQSEHSNKSTTPSKVKTSMKKKMDLKSPTKSKANKRGKAIHAVDTDEYLQEELVQNLGLTQQFISDTELQPPHFSTKENLSKPDLAEFETIAKKVCVTNSIFEKQSTQSDANTDIQVDLQQDLYTQLSTQKEAPQYYEQEEQKLQTITEQFETEDINLATQNQNQEMISEEQQPSVNSQSKPSTFFNEHLTNSNGDSKQGIADDEYPDILSLSIKSEDKMRIGQGYQAALPSLTDDTNKPVRKPRRKPVKVWNPNKIDENRYEKFRKELLKINPDFQFLLEEEIAKLLATNNYAVTTAVKFCKSNHSLVQQFLGNAHGRKRILSRKIRNRRNGYQ